MLNVEVKGVEYPKNRQGGPIFPAFKTAEFSQDLIDQIYPYLSEGETCLTNGPVFCDYAVPTRNLSLDPEKTETSVSKPEAPSSDGAGTRSWSLVDGRTFEAEFLASVGNKVLFKKASGKTIRIPKGKLSPEALDLIQLETPPDFDISFSKQSTQRFYPDSRLNQPVPESTDYTFSAKVKQVSTKPYNFELQVELFVIGAEVNGDKYILLDHQKGSFIPTEENKRSFKISGKPVELTEFIIGHEAVGMESRGQKYSSYLVVVTDSRGEIIAHESPKKWLFENYGNLKNIPVGAYIDKTCKRVRPTRPRTLYY
jgi:hypothetical protein